MKNIEQARQDLSKLLAQSRDILFSTIFTPLRFVSVKCFTFGSILLSVKDSWKVSGCSRPHMRGPQLTVGGSKVFPVIRVTNSSACEKNMEDI